MFGRVRTKFTIFCVSFLSLTSSFLKGGLRTEEIDCLSQLSKSTPTPTPTRKEISPEKEKNKYKGMSNMVSW